MAKNLTLKQEAFVKAYLETGNASEAYRRAYDVAKMKESTIRRQASTMMAHPVISERVKNYRKDAAEDVLIGQRDILRNWLTILTADRRELMTHRRLCCRHCYGVDGKFQWRDEDEYNLACAEVIDHNAGCTTRNRRKRKDLPSDSGGYGFKRTRAPNKECKKCEGEGHPETFVQDFANLSPAAQLLYTGMKVTKEGIEIKMMDKDRALDNLAKALGVLKPEGVTINNLGPTVQAAEVPSDPNDAAKFYRDFMGKDK